MKKIMKKTWVKPLDGCENVRVVFVCVVAGGGGGIFFARRRFSDEASKFVSMNSTKPRK